MTENRRKIWLSFSFHVLREDFRHIRDDDIGIQVYSVNDIFEAGDLETVDDEIDDAPSCC